MTKRRACLRVQQALNEALSEGRLTLPPELSAHAQLCPTCRPAVAEVRALLGRLESVPAGFSLGPVPGVVEKVLTGSARKRVRIRWMVRQFAALGALLLLAFAAILLLVAMIGAIIGGAGLLVIHSLYEAALVSPVVSPLLDRELLRWLYLISLNQRRYLHIAALRCL